MSMNHHQNNRIASFMSDILRFGYKGFHYAKRELKSFPGPNSPWGGPFFWAQACCPHFKNDYIDLLDRNKPIVLSCDPLPLSGIIIALYNMGFSLRWMHNLRQCDEIEEAKQIKRFVDKYHADAYYLKVKLGWRPAINTGDVPNAETTTQRLAKPSILSP